MSMVTDLFEIHLMSKKVDAVQPAGKEPDSLRTVAAECVEWQHRGCSGNCDRCAMNLGHYVDVKTAGLMHAEAVADRRALDDSRDLKLWGNIGSAVTWLLIIGGILFLFRGCF